MVMNVKKEEEVLTKADVFVCTYIIGSRSFWGLLSLSVFILNAFLSIVWLVGSLYLILTAPEIEWSCFWCDRSEYFLSAMPHWSWFLLSSILSIIVAGQGNLANKFVDLLQERRAAEILARDSDDLDDSNDSDTPGGSGNGCYQGA